jgi:hypothetical protein
MPPSGACVPVGVARCCTVLRRPITIGAPHRQTTTFAPRVHLIRQARAPAARAADRMVAGPVCRNNHRGAHRRAQHRRNHRRSAHTPSGIRRYSPELRHVTVGVPEKRSRPVSSPHCHRHHRGRGLMSSLFAARQPQILHRARASASCSWRTSPVRVVGFTTYQVLVSVAGGVVHRGVVDWPSTGCDA